MRIPLQKFYGDESWLWHNMSTSKTTRCSYNHNKSKNCCRKPLAKHGLSNRVTALFWAADIWHFPKSRCRFPDCQTDSITMLGELQWHHMTSLQELYKTYIYSLYGKFRCIWKSRLWRNCAPCKAWWRTNLQHDCVHRNMKDMKIWR